MGNENKKDDQAAARKASLSAPICSEALFNTFWHMMQRVASGDMDPSFAAKKATNIVLSVKKDSLEHEQSLAKELCELQDALGCPCEELDCQEKAMKRIHHLIAVERGHVNPEKPRNSQDPKDRRDFDTND